MNISNSFVLADAAINQDTIVSKVGDLLSIIQVVGIAVIVLSAVAALVISVAASERSKDTWYGRAKIAFVIAVLVVTIPQLVKWLLDILGQGDKYKLNAVGTIAKQLAISPLATLKSLL
ncbi:hypothetical protein [Lactococcus kimchii]|uniref:hypothetical protein n=1 Tax=Lactococcus sp. S-13 TaxID=2507158 RepID=UPI001023BB49|nr:hypothetical protein [Lactococcus sp. S-13]RZI47894.1 hypothetical protein EQJ87_10765 [Lactococcus sp. S-13]